MTERNKVHRGRVRAAGEAEFALVAKMQRGGEPTVGEFLEAARRAGKVSKGTPASKSKREQSYQSVQEKQRPTGKPPAREWKVQSGKGGVFVLVHRESGDYYADYVSTPITSWGAKRFLTVKDAYAHLNDPKYFSQGTRKQSSWNQTKTRGDKVQERYRKKMGFQD